MCVSQGLFNELPIDGHLGCFQSLALVNSVIVWNCAFVFSYFGQGILEIPRSGIAGSEGRGTCNFAR